MKPVRVRPISGGFSKAVLGPRDGAGPGADVGRMPRDFERGPRPGSAPSRRGPFDSIRAQLSRVRSHTIPSFRRSSGDAGGGPGAASPHRRPAPRATATKPARLLRPTAIRPGPAEKPVQKRSISGTFRFVLDSGFRRGDGGGKSLRVPPVSGDFSTPLGPRDGAGLGGIRRRLWARGPRVRRPKHRSRTQWGASLL